MRKVVWDNGHSVGVLPIKAELMATLRATHKEFEAHHAPDNERVRQKRVRIERLAGRVRDRSRDIIRQSGGYVMSGWAKQTKAGVSHASRRLANQSLKKLVLG